MFIFDMFILNEALGGHLTGVVENFFQAYRAEILFEDADTHNYGYGFGLNSTVIKTIPNRTGICFNSTAGKLIKNNWL